MDQRQIVAAAVAGLFALGAASGAALAQAPKGDAKGMEKCFGVAKAGQNDCSTGLAPHACAGQAKVDSDPNDFKLVKTGTCTQMGGKLQPAGKKS
jgi:uncharacterized membrane protein